MTEDRYSLSAKVFRKLREDILSGKYQPEEELKEQVIADELGVSRTPVREALRQLELERLIRIVPNRGAFVEGITTKDVKDIYQIRMLLEGLCASWAAQNVTEEQLQELEENVYLAEFHASKGNWAQMVELDNRFHEIIYQASGSKELNHVLSDYHQYLIRVRSASLHNPSRVKECKEEHRKIVEALKLRDPKAAEEAASTHIAGTIANFECIGLNNI